ncbi:MAG: AAA family ATPase [Eubacteriales bacterium]
MKRLYLIGGTMGVGKTTTCRILKNRLDDCVFLDGDWCWDMHPFQLTEETKRMVMDNICHLLNNFIRCTAYQNIVFCWVMHEQSIIDRIRDSLPLDGVLLHTVSLVCRKDALEQRLWRDVENGIRTADVIARSTARLPLYDSLDTVKIDVSDISADDAADILLRL